MSETPYLNLSFKILWRDTTIASKNPTDPPRSDKTHKAFSGIRHIFCSAEFLSTSMRIKIKILTMSNQTIKTNSMSFKSVLTALPLGFLERERERRQNFKIDSQIHSFKKLIHSNMIFSMIAPSLFSKFLSLRKILLFVTLYTQIEKLFRVWLFAN